MPFKPRRLCSCGNVVWSGELCTCQVARRRETNQRRESAHDRGYDSKWKKARAGFLAKHPACVMCGKPATVVDHIQPHRGDKHLFWNTRNWQPLCEHHHNSTKQRQERRQ